MLGLELVLKMLEVRGLSFLLDWRFHYVLCYGISIFIQELYLACFEFLLNWFKQSNLSIRYNNNIYNLS